MSPVHKQTLISGACACVAGTTGMHLSWLLKIIQGAKRSEIVLLAENMILVKAAHGSESLWPKSEIS
jgi:hypothetical protein